MKIGDIVAIVAQDCSDYGLVGKIIDIEMSSLLPYTVEWEIEGLKDHSYFSKSELQVVS